MSMKGSEKQISWAQEIQTTVIDVFDEAIKVYEAMNNYPDKDKAIQTIEKFKCALLDAEYASDVIDIFKDVHPCGNNRKDLSSVLAKYRVHFASTPGQKKILCR